MRRRSMRPGAKLLGFVALVGCADLAGIDDYRVSEPPAGPAANIAVAFDPAPACTSCAIEECRKDLEDCASDPDCFELYRCRAECGPDPGCRWGCYGPFAASRRAAGKVGLLSTREADCVREKCADPCRTGRHFECVEDEFDWPGPDTDSVEMWYRVVGYSVGNSHPATGFSVRLCELVDTDAARLLDTDCSDPVDPPTGTKATDVNGDVTVVHPNRVQSGGKLESVPSYLLLEGQSEQWDAPTSTRVYWSFVPSRPGLGLLFAFPNFPAAGPLVAGSVMDCNLDYKNLARGVSIEVQSDPPAVPGPVGYCESWPCTVTDRTDGSGLFKFGVTASTTVEIAAVDADSGRQIGRMRFPFNFGENENANVLLAPAGRSGP